jgi:glycosyltransferase involved in cell wall biosynthesis
MPNILVENMAAGLPIACSNMGPMLELLGNSGVYFDPCDAEDIACALRKLINSADLRSHLAQLAYERAQQYSWKRCADETFGFLTRVAQDNKV